MKILWIFFGVITKLDFIYISMHFRVFLLKMKVQNGGYQILLGCLNFKYLFGVLEIPDIFEG